MTKTDLGYTTQVYVKEHNKTGLKYFGKTKKADVRLYNGSGVEWEKHLQEHGVDVKTIVVFESCYKEELIDFCMTFSKMMDVVASPEWANMIVENGLDGACPGEDHHFYGKNHSEETKALLSKLNTGENHPKYGTKASPETLAKMTGENNHNYGLPPWEFGRANKELWKDLDTIYDWWFPMRRQKYGNGAYAAATYFKSKNQSTLRTIMEWIKTNGDPRLNKDWIEFKRMKKNE